MDGLTWLFGTTDYKRWTSKAVDILNYSEGSTLTIDGYTCRLGSTGEISISGAGVADLTSEVRKMAAYFVVLGGTVNTIYDPFKAVMNLANYRSYIDNRSKLLNRTLDDVFPPHADLTPTQMQSISRHPLNTDKSWNLFLSAVTQYLGRPPTNSDFAGKGNIPVAEISQAAASYGSLVKQYPKFFEAYIEYYSKVIDATADQAKKLTMSLFSGYEASVGRSFNDDAVSRYVNSGGKHQVGYELLISRPTGLNFEDRVVWLHTVAGRVRQTLDKYFNKRTEVMEDELIQAIEILPSDKIHELSKFMILLLKEVLLKKPPGGEDSIRLLGRSVLVLQESNRTLITTFTEAVCLLAVYLSVVGTNPKKLRQIATSMTFIVDGVEKRIDFSASLRSVASSGLIMGKNAQRCFSRKLSTLTYLLRVKGGIKTSIWPDAVLSDNALNYDTVNCLDLRYVRRRALPDIEVCRRKILAGGASRGKSINDHI